MIQLDLMDYVPAPHYPDGAGYKASGASQEAAELVDRTGNKHLWMSRCKALYDMRPDWTAEEGINYYAMDLKEDIRAVDKALRPRFCELVIEKFLCKTDERRGENRVKPHVYRRAQ
jgi:hypothetical protein